MDTGTANGTRFLGKPCRKGHSGWRYKSTLGCVECILAGNNRAHHQKASLAYVRRNRKAVNARNTRWREANRGRLNALIRRWKKKNSGRVAEQCRARQAGLKERTPAWANRRQMAGLYKIAKMLSKTRGIRYSVDHVIPLHGELVSGLHVETNLSIMTLSANAAKFNRVEL